MVAFTTVVASGAVAVTVVSGVDEPTLVPTWFAVAFWVAFVALVVIVARDVRRLGGPRAVVAALRERFRFEDEDDAGRGDDENAPDDDETAPPAQ